MVQAPMSQRLQLLQVLARSGTETPTSSQHDHNNQRNRRENQADAVICRQGFEFVKRKFRIHPHVWFAVSRIDLEVDFPSIRKGFLRIQFWGSRRLLFQVLQSDRTRRRLQLCILF